MKSKFCGNYVVMTKPNKDINLNVRVTSEVRKGFKAVALLRGKPVSVLLNEYMVELIRAERERNERVFEEKLLLVDEQEKLEKEKRESVKSETLTKLPLRKQKTQKSLPSKKNGKETNGKK